MHALGRPRRPRPRGFTLIELLVAVLVGVIVFAGIYLMYESSTRGYRIQNLTLDGLAQLRGATRQLRADLRSAGFNAPVQSNIETWVTVSGTAIPLVAVAVEDDPAAPVALPAFNQNIVPQRIRILGDFWSHDVYTIEQVAGNTVNIRWTDTSVAGQREFERVFRPGRFMRIEGYGTARREDVVPIQAAAFDPGNLTTQTVTLANPVTGVGGFGTGSEASVIGFVQYRLQNDTRRDAASVKFDLVREEVDLNGNPINGGALIIAENIVDLRVYDICFNAQATDPATMQQVPVQMQCAPRLADLAGGDNLDPGDAQNISHELRSLTVKVASRTPFEDPELLFAPRGTVDEPLRAFELDATQRGAARVFEMAATVVLTSIQARRQ